MEFHASAWPFNISTVYLLPNIHRLLFKICQLTNSLLPTLQSWLFFFIPIWFLRIRLNHGASFNLSLGSCRKEFRPSNSAVGWYTKLVGYFIAKMGWRTKLVEYFIATVGWRTKLVEYFTATVGWRTKLVKCFINSVGWRTKLVE